MGSYPACGHCSDVMAYWQDFFYHIISHSIVTKKFHSLSQFLREKACQISCYNSIAIDFFLPKSVPPPLAAQYPTIRKVTQLR